MLPHRRACYHRMNMLRLLAWCALVLACAGVARADTSAAERVALDWAEVPDRLIRRCRLTGLQSLVLQHVVESGRAVVDVGRAPDVVVHITAGDDRIGIEARGADRASAREIPIPAACDSWIQLDVAHAVVQALEAWADARTPSHASAATSIAPPEPAQDAPGRVRLGAGVSILSGEVVPHAALELVPFTALPAAVAVEVAGTAVGELVIVEPSLAARVEPSLMLGEVRGRVGFEAALLVHTFRFSARDRGARLYARLAVPVAIGTASDGLTVSVTPWFRPTAVEHRVEGGEDFDSGRFGVSLRVTVGL
jgi:hypothetical protein